MTLRQKTTLTIIVTVAIITSLLYAILYTIIMNEYVSLDEEINRQNVKRAFSEINHKLISLKTLTAEWSAWDDTYAYMAGEYPTYIEDNIFEISFSTLNMNFMLFYDDKGNLYHGEGYDTIQHEYIEIPDAFKNIFNNDAFRKERLEKGMTGVISADNTLLLMCALPIQKSDWKGSNGTLIIARYLDARLVEELNESLVYPLTPVTLSDLDPYTKNQVAKTIQNDHYTFIGYTSDANIIDTYGIYNDIYDNPAFIFKVSSQKQIYRQGKETIMFILLYLTGAGCIIAILGSYVMNKYIISRLMNLTDEVSNITLDGNLERSVKADGSDEIGILGKSINKMLAAIFARTEELKKTHEALKKAKDEAEEANETKSRFLANMSHEIRTPLNGIIGMTDLAYMTELTPQQKTYLEMVKYSGNILQNIINDILDFSKIEAGKLQLENIEFNLKDLIEKLTRLVSTRALQKNIEVILDIDKNTPTFVIGDPMRLNQILINILSNAIKFTEKGEIYIKVGTNSADDIVFSISDTGIGISLDKIDKMFEEFTQADSSITRKYGGTGLGLAISNQLIQSMGGEIKVQSDLGSGSTFTFRIPFKLSPTQAINANPIDYTGKSILIVEKNARIRENLRKICADIGIQHLILSSSEEVLEVASSKKKFDVVIIDLYLEKMDGLELSKKLSTMLASSVPIILLVSPADTIGDPMLLKELNIFDQIIKPILPSEFVSAVQNALNRSPQLNKYKLDRYNYMTFEDKTVLVAEDGYINRKIIIELLKKLHINILSADNGETALALFKNNSVDLVIMDIEMPIMDGFEATSRIKEDCINRKINVPIIAVTAYILESEIQKCFAAGMDDYVCKPVNLDTLYEKLIKHLSPSTKTMKQYINHQKLVDLVSGEEAFIGDLLMTFTNSYIHFLEEAKSFARKDDIIQCKKTLHGLKGTVASLYIQYGFENIVELEENIGNYSIEAILEKINIIETKLKEVEDYIIRTYESN